MIKNKKLTTTFFLLDPVDFPFEDILLSKDTSDTSSVSEVDFTRGVC